MPTCYSPVRRSTQEPKLPFALDLHVLGTPPALILSQDQTLELDLLRTPKSPEPPTSKVCLAFEVCLLEYRITRLAFFSLYLVFKEQAPWGNFAAYYNGELRSR